MPTPITMPRLGLTMVEGTVVEWKVRRGERVDAGHVLLIVESEKAEVEVEAFASGVVAAIYVEAGETVPTGALLGAIAEPGEAFDHEAFAARFVPETAAQPAEPSRSQASRAARAPAPAAAGVKAAPAARALAKRLGVDLEGIAGTGPAGRITVEDVEREALAPAGGLSLAATVAGAGPPLFFVCGFGVDATGWRRQIDGLRSDHTVVTYDHRGIGASRPMPDGSLTLAVLADDALSLLDRHPGAVAIGASMGAAVALEMALRRPQSIRGLVLVSPVVEPDPRFEAVLRSFGDYETADAEARIRGMLPWFLGRDFLAQAGKREAAARALRAMATRTPIAALSEHARALVEWLGGRPRDLARVTVPALIAAGSDDVLTPPWQAEAAARAFSAARVEIFAGAGHALMIERPGELNALVRSFESQLV